MEQDKTEQSRTVRNGKHNAKQLNIKKDEETATTKNNREGEGGRETKESKHEHETTTPKSHKTSERQGWKRTLHTCQHNSQHGNAK